MAGRRPFQIVSVAAVLLLVAISGSILDGFGREFSCSMKKRVVASSNGADGSGAAVRKDTMPSFAAPPKRRQRSDKGPRLILAQLPMPTSVDWLTSELYRMRVWVDELQAEQEAQWKGEAAARSRKSAMFKATSASGQPFIEKTCGKETIAAAWSLWDGTAAKEKGQNNGFLQRKQTIKTVVTQLWGGELLKELQQDYYKTLRFDKVKMAYVLDQNPNLNYTAVDLFRGMENGIKPCQRGLVPGRSSIQQIHSVLYDASKEVLGSEFPEDKKGAVWTTDPELALTNYFKDLYISTGIDAPKDDPWIVTVTAHERKNFEPVV